MGSKKYRGKACVYRVDGVATTADHIVAREFFPGDRRADLPKAPACTRCNGQKSVLEAYLTTVLPFGSTHSAALCGQLEKVGRRLELNARLREELCSGAQPALVRAEDGALTPTFTLPFDGEKFVEYGRLVVRGLIWHEWGVIVPAEYTVEVMTLTQLGYSFFRDYLLKMNPQGRRDATHAGGGFAYSCTRNSTDPAFSAWHIQMYDGVNLAEADGEAGLEMCAMTGPATIRRLIDRFVSLADGERRADG